MGLLRSLGCNDLRREGSVLKALLKTRRPEDIETAVHGLKVIFPDGPISLKMIHGRSRIGFYCGFVSAFNAGVSRVAPAERSGWREGTSPPPSRHLVEPRLGTRTGTVESVGDILARVGVQ